MNGVGHGKATRYVETPPEASTLSNVGGGKGDVCDTSGW